MIEQYLCGGLVLVLFVVVYVVFQQASRRERIRLRDRLVQNLEQLIRSLDDYRDLDDILSLLDIAELQVRHIEHVDPIGFDGSRYRMLLQHKRADMIFAKVQERVLIRMSEARKTDMPGTKLAHLQAAETQLQRWMGHPSLEPEQRHTLKMRLAEIEEILSDLPILADIRLGLRHERNGRLPQALASYEQALAQLSELPVLRSDERILIEDLQSRIARIKERIDGAFSAMPEAAQQSAEPRPT